MLGGMEELPAQIGGIRLPESQDREEHPGFVTSAGMHGIQAVAPQLLNINDGGRTPGKSHPISKRIRHRPRSNTGADSDGVIMPGHRCL